MLVGKLNTLLGTVNRLKSYTPTVKGQTGSPPKGTDRVDISEAAMQKLPSDFAQRTMSQFKSALVDTLSVKTNSPTDVIYDVMAGPIEQFISEMFAPLEPELKKEFMADFTSLSKVSGGLVSESLVNDAFGGGSDSFPQMIEQISRELNSHF